MVFRAENMDIMAYHWLAYDGPLVDATLGLNAIDWSTGWPVLTDALAKALASQQDEGGWTKKAGG